MPETWFLEKRLLKKHESNSNLDIYKFTVKFPDFIAGMDYI